MKRIVAFSVLAAGGLALSQEPPEQLPKPRVAQPEIKQAVPLMRIGGQPLAKIDRATAAKNLPEQYKTMCQMFVDGLSRYETQEEKAKYLVAAPKPATYAARAAALVLEKPEDEISFDLLKWMLRYTPNADVQKAFEAVVAKPGAAPVKFDPFAILAQHHLSNPGLLAVLNGVMPNSHGADALLAAAYEKSTDAAIRGNAGLKLAADWKRKSENEKATEAERKSAEAKAIALYDKLSTDETLADVKVGLQPLRKTAAGELVDLRDLAIGKPLPELVSEGLFGKSGKLVDYRGKVVVVDVWATWCGPCKAMIPHEREMTTRLADKPFQLISVSCDDKKETLTEFLDKESMPWVHWWAGRGGDVSKALNIRFYPTIFVIDHKGIIRHKNIRGEKLEEAVVKLLKEAEKN